MAISGECFGCHSLGVIISQCSLCLNWFCEDDCHHKCSEEQKKKAAASMADRYLGDGVYASFDGNCVWLDCRGQATLTFRKILVNGSEGCQCGTRSIALEPQVFLNLSEYAREAFQVGEFEPESEDKNDGD